MTLTPMMQDQTRMLEPINTLLTLVARLRDPVDGCPWDKQQTWKSIVPHTLEEVYEVVAAIDDDNTSEVCDELGDLLFHVVLMAQIAQEQGKFNFTDIVNGVSQKLIRRHPHVFGEKHYGSVAEQKEDWEAIKQLERQQMPKNEDFFGNIPRQLTALQRTQKLQKRVATVGFDWEHWSFVIPKIQEELLEVEEAVTQNESFERVQEEMGDVLLACANLARMLKVNAENALRLANEKFVNRFLKVEAVLMSQNITLEMASLDQLQAAWDEVKKCEKLKQMC